MTACRDGFPADDGEGGKADVEEAAALGAPEAGDEAVAFGMHGAGGEAAVISCAAVRSGPRPSVFSGFSGFSGADISGPRCPGSRKGW
ncbi:hypothetical protein ACFW9V_08785 [Streptomyces hygroscopicus]|uniref:hypothetical protein n=1 Tax=Streptomyces TaxID=1883 RepID=UPI0007DB3402|nr:MULTISPECIES: hypothetical protein [unclassified Streptomyces]MDN3055868.1 hypothetical protein [Streptomyces sp. SRF1]